MIDPSQLRHRQAIAVIARSAIAGAFYRVRDRFESAAGESRAGLWTQRVTNAWQALDRQARLRSIGTLLVTAAAVHLFLQWFYQHPVSWLWIVVPGIALAQGLMLLAVSGPPSSDPS